MKTPLQNTKLGTDGFTLVEAMIAVTFLAVLFLAVAQTSSRASDAFDEGSADHSLSVGTHRCLERMAQAVEFADVSVFTGLSTTLGATSVQFQVPEDFAGDVVVWSTVRIAFERDAEELDDGVDNDGDGLVDEGIVVETLAPGTPQERRVILARNVAELAEGELANNADDNGNGLTDEPGLSFSAKGNVVELRLTCQNRDEAKRMLTKTATTAVRPRNTGG